MTMFFTEDEKKYIVTSKGAWRVKADCPSKVKAVLEKKIEFFYKQEEGTLI